MKDKKDPGIHHHFRRESKIMLWWLVGIPVVLLIAGLLVTPVVLWFLNRASS
ncbi:hypothetical protein [Comamonas sp. 4034]|uniref:hypothetical protein n=1 Tax=Comamonas sp. 4034 TaxID=3156455 RepID=UPI003D1B2427